MTSSMVVIGNPGAGSYSQRRLNEAVDRLSSAGTNVEVFLTRTKGDAETEAKRIAYRKPAAIVVAGGDGTINDVANGLAKSPVAVGILPMGSVNVLSREIGISKDVGRASRQIMEGREHSIALGRISSGNGHAVRYFLLMADIGYGGRTVAELNNRLKCLSSRTAFVISGTKNLLKKPSQLLTFTVDGVPYQGYHAVIGKVSRYGGNFKVTPYASILRNELHACIFKNGRRLDLAKYVMGVATGRHHTFRDVVSLKCRQIVVEGRAHIQVDGNYFGKTPVMIDSIENALNLIY
jgi:YegS/Rv2252/BmrU family lipid kinase